MPAHPRTRGPNDRVAQFGPTPSIQYRDVFDGSRTRQIIPGGYEVTTLRIGVRTYYGKGGFNGMSNLSLLDGLITNFSFLGPPARMVSASREIKDKITSVVFGEVPEQEVNTLLDQELKELLDGANADQDTNNASDSDSSSAITISDTDDSSDDDNSVISISDDSANSGNSSGDNMETSPPPSPVSAMRFRLGPRPRNIVDLS